MATRSLLTALSRSYTPLSLSTPLPSTFSLLRLRPLIAVASGLRIFPPATLTVSASLRGFATRQTPSWLNDLEQWNFSIPPPKKKILLDGCDFEHWLVVMEKPEGDPTRDEIIDRYIKTLATIVGSEEEARMKIYSVSTGHYYTFGALVSEELSCKLKELPKVRRVLPDFYKDVKNKDYGGEPFINGQAVPYDPKYHEWVRINARANERNRRIDQIRRSRNFERRREMQKLGFNVRNASPPNMGGMQQQPPNMGGMQQPGMGGAPPNYGGGTPRNYNYGGTPNNPTNFQCNGGMPYQTGPGTNQNYASNTSGGNHYQNPNRPPPSQNYGPNSYPHQNQNMPGRDPNDQ